jgi:hypothetical protein
MLLGKTLNSGDVASIKLNNGDEIIAKITDLSDTLVTVTKPLLMILSQDPRTGQPGVQMAPFWMMGANHDDKFSINRQQIVCMVKSNDDAKANYTTQTTGLAVPRSGGLIT